MKLATDRIMNVVIGTAGHVDHGKTSLVKALTGVDADRWEEEKRRGITIDIGFASRELPDGRRVGFIDVPGHERFVRHMIAGAAGVDVVLLVVAADDGVMPQTREHLDILRLLGVREGVVAVTKMDVDRELAAIAVEEVRAYLEGTVLRDAPVVPVSSVTGEGIGELWEALGRAAAKAVARPADGLFRMPVQRVFTREGFGTVLTGVPVSGTVAAGDVVEVLPGGGRARVRGVQAYFRDVDVARAGHSTGLNVADVDPALCRRGQVVVPPDTFEPAALVDARLLLLPAAARPLVSGAGVRFHTGTAAVGAKVTLLDRERLRPGDDALVQLRLDEPVVFGRLDRFIVRSSSPSVTTGGGTITGPGRRRLRPNRPNAAEAARRLEVAAASDESFVEHLIADAPGGCIRLEKLVREALLPQARTREIAGALAAGGRVRAFARGTLLVGARTAERAREGLTRLLAELHAGRPDLPGLTAGQSAEELGVAAEVVEAVASAGEFARDGEFIRLASHRPELAEGEGALAGRIEDALGASPFMPPDEENLAKGLGVEGERVRRVVSYLEREGRLVRVPGGMVFRADAVARARAFVVEELRGKGALETAALKAFMASSGGTSRKYLLPLLEHFDAAGLTRREGERRVPGRRQEDPEASGG